MELMLFDIFFFCRKNFKHIDKMLFVDGSYTITIFVDKMCWRNWSLYEHWVTD